MNISNPFKGQSWQRTCNTTFREKLDDTFRVIVGAREKKEENGHVSQEPREGILFTLVKPFLYVSLMSVLTGVALWDAKNSKGAGKFFKRILGAPLMLLGLSGAAAVLIPGAAASVALMLAATPIVLLVHIASKITNLFRKRSENRGRVSPLVVYSRGATQGRRARARAGARTIRAIRSESRAARRGRAFIPGADAGRRGRFFMPGVDAARRHQRRSERRIHVHTGSRRRFSGRVR